MKKANIIGAGLVGSLWSLYLQQRGYHVDIYERRPDPRKAGYIGGRSINLALSDRGWKALKGAGIQQEVEAMAIPMRRRVIHAKNGSLSFQPYGQSGQAIYSVSRGGLNQLLINKAEASGQVKVHFDHACDSISMDSGTATLSHEGTKIQSEADVLFGADGAFSRVRKSLHDAGITTEHKVYPIDHGYKELSIPPSADGSYQLEKEALHIWPRGGFMLIALPNPDATFTCTLFLSLEGETSFAGIEDLKTGRAFIQSHFPDAFDLMPDFDAMWTENPVSPLTIVHCFPWTSAGKVALMGDAAHAIVPFYGQGMNAGFESCTVLNDLLDLHDDDIAVSLAAFEATRKADADAISDLALRNFIEMRDLTGQPSFLLRKKIESRLSLRHPDKWLPLYSQVTFSHIPYAKSLAAGVLQDQVMAPFMARPDIASTWDSETLEQEILDAWAKAQAAQ